jgi:murein DD-endopeptidase MepM/ murein hydrolase activator NlpD
LEIVRWNLLLPVAVISIGTGLTTRTTARTWTEHDASRSRQFAAGTAPIDVALAARSIQPGELVVLTLTARTDADRLRVAAFGRPVGVVAIGSREWRALVGIDLDVAPGNHPVLITIRVADQDLSRTYELAVKPRRFATRRLEVGDAFVNPPAGELVRIERENVELERLWHASADEALWIGPFAAPVPDRATSSFGTRSIFNGERRSPHSGTDFLSPAGTPIRAPNAGRVVFSGDLYFSGNTLVIDHGLGVVSLFAHLSAFAVQEGDVVSKGQLVGNVGATGRVTGPHLHWAVRVNGARVDPLAVLAVLGK